MKSSRIFATVSVGALMGCTQFSGVMAPADPGATARSRPPAQPGPVWRTRAGALNDLGEMYHRGRQAQDEGRLPEAEDQYTAILRIDPGHGDALNALGVLRGRAGRFKEALGLFDRALAAEPGSVSSLNNRGYALLLAGRLNEAEADFLKARTLDPAHARVQANLAQLAQLARTTAAASAATTPTQAGPRIVEVSPQVYELQDRPLPHTTASSGSASAMLLQQDVAVRGLAGVRLEVSNGVGIRKMAWRTAKRLETLGAVTTRLSNQPGYRQQTTEIQYRAGYERAAHDLAARLPNTPPARQARLNARVQVRLVLGHDLVGKEVAMPGSVPEPGWVLG
jgi:tetratricopeptide (TPR) repeat protein